jgi:hypothetical protein
MNPSRYDADSLDPVFRDGDLVSERPNPLFADPVDAVLPGLWGGTFYESV